MSPVEPLKVCKEWGTRCKQWPRCPCGINGVDPRPAKPASAPEGTGPSA